MKVAGFSFIRNAVKYDFPIRESLLSLAPLCDELFIAVGRSEDGTEALIETLKTESIPHLTILPTVWDENLREGGRVLASETDKAFREILARKSFDWSLYLQGDEVIHENDYKTIRNDLEKYQNDPHTEGLLFKYHHFYGSYQYTGNSRKWYRREIRAVKTREDIFSYKDAQGFRIRKPDGTDRKLNVRLTSAYIYHYGWVRRPDVQQVRNRDFQRLWHSDERIEAMNLNDLQYNYHQIDRLAPFTGTHPPTMIDRIARQDWTYEYRPGKAPSFSRRLLHAIEKQTGKRLFEYRNYRLLN